MSAVSLHYNEREQQTRAERTESPIYALRCINNWVKSVLMRDHVAPDAQVDVLDLCGGRGGDLNKWARCGARNVTLVDLAPEEVNRARDRWRQRQQQQHKHKQQHHASTQLRTSVEFVCADAFSPMPELRDNAFDVVSCQFALHYAFGRSAAVQALFENVSRSLKPGGVFICTFPDFDRVVNYCFRDPSANIDQSDSTDRHAGSGAGENSGCGVYSNSICRIAFDKPKNDMDAGRLPAFGALYHFSLGDAIRDCPEYLVDDNVLMEESAIAGLKLVRTQTFDDLCHDAVEKNQQHADLWRTMVERPPSHDEWDVVCLYRACVFVREAHEKGMRGNKKGYSGERRLQVSYKDCWHDLPGFEHSRFVFSGSEQMKGVPQTETVDASESVGATHNISATDDEKASVPPKKRRKATAASSTQAQTKQKEAREDLQSTENRLVSSISMPKNESRKETDIDREETDADKDEPQQVLSRKPTGAVVYRDGDAIKKGARVKPGDSFEHNGRVYVKSDGSGWHLMQT